jgi:hypothetical protein
VHYRLAELYASKGDRLEAIDSLDALARLWKNGDPHLPLAERAARLRSKLAAP